MGPRPCGRLDQEDQQHEEEDRQNEDLNELGICPGLQQCKKALFGFAAEIIKAQCNVTVKANFQQTWPWLKKALKREFDD